MDFNERLEVLLKSEKMTAKELTEKLEVGKTTINDWKRGKSTPSPKTLIGLSHIFNISIDWLLTGKEGIINELSKDENQIITTYRNSDVRGRHAILNVVINELNKIEEVECSEDITSKHMPVITNGLHKNKEEGQERNETSEELAIPARTHSLECLVKR
ncbi:MAG: helix-turn-helix domain-containing protein [Defluviitaleaceae bacterium]|nr:helix-turn-helix domain-containing protein [Defluviitaleaceae bacterium]MCL2836690.1 helix-turn-helix domain-containing protein [Defluviitaleaceae bacterium]